MRFRLVTAAVAVALGAWSGSMAFGQEGMAQEDILDIVAPPADFDRILQSELPLKGAIDTPVFPGSIAESSPVQAPAVDAAWLDRIRRGVRDAPHREIAAALVGLVAFSVAVWILGTSAFRRRARRAYRRFPRSSGGSKVRGLEKVVASVQLGRTGRSGRADA